MIESWQEIPLDSCTTPAGKRTALRLNSLGSLYYFSKYVLAHDRLSPRLHGMLCSRFESYSLHTVLEVPRDHLKTTIGSVSAPIWWALPFTDQDEALMRALGYGDAWIRWMRRAHSTSTRTLIATEVIGNARKIGAKISGNYLSNATFRNLFPEIIPRKSDRWNQDSMTQNRIEGVYHGEGTFDFIGKGGALQSRHYNRIVEDDLVGEKAVYSDVVMESTVEWHRKLPGVLDANPDDPNQIGDQVIIGNRWSHRDLNSWVREHESHYKFETHSAEGGCCPAHPAGEPIFPEMFTMEKLASLRRTLGSYSYACHFLNEPVDPEACRFKSSWLPHYALDVQIGEAVDARTPIVHEVRNGQALPDVRLNQLNRVTILDVNHSESAGRCRHALLTVGYIPRQGNTPPRVYFLEAWAKACSFEEMIDMAIGKNGLALKWRCHHLYVETAAGQDGWYFVFQQKMRQLGIEAGFTVRKLVTDKSAGGKDRRITGMEAVYENGMFFTPKSGRGIETFMGEYERYPNGSTVDLLDVAGYIPQTIDNVSMPGAHKFQRSEIDRRRSLIENIGVCGY